LIMLLRTGPREEQARGRKKGVLKKNKSLRVLL
jgi:hypothetical protein